VHVVSLPASVYVAILSRPGLPSIFKCSVRRASVSELVSVWGVSSSLPETAIQDVCSNVLVQVPVQLFYGDAISQPAAVSFRVLGLSRAHPTAGFLAKRADSELTSNVLVQVPVQAVEPMGPWSAEPLL